MVRQPLPKPFRYSPKEKTKPIAVSSSFLRAPSAVEHDPKWVLVPKADYQSLPDDRASTFQEENNNNNTTTTTTDRPQRSCARKQSLENIEFDDRQDPEFKIDQGKSSPSPKGGNKPKSGNVTSKGEKKNVESESQSETESTSESESDSESVQSASESDESDEPKKKNKSKSRGKGRKQKSSKSRTKEKKHRSSKKEKIREKGRKSERKSGTDRKNKRLRDSDDDDTPTLSQADYWKMRSEESELQLRQEMERRHLRERNDLLDKYDPCKK
jgi:hypothetical protein